MGLLDSLLGDLAGQPDAPAGAHPLAGVLGGLLEQNGGLQGLMGKFSQGGLGDVFSSWVGTGGNQAISAAQIQNVLGSEQVQALAAKLGIDPAMASTLLAQYLPMIIDRLTPHGQVNPATDHPQGLAGLLPSLLKTLSGGEPR